MSKARELSVVPNQYSNFKNRIINGAMQIDQRNAGASVTPAHNNYTLDRWQCMLSQSSKYTVQQNAGSVTPPAGFTSYLGVTSSSAYSVGSSDYFAIRQQIEGLNVADMGWGTASASTFTISFWVRSSLSGTFGGAFENDDNNRSYPFTYTISVANTWEQKTVTIAGDTTGTWYKTTACGGKVLFSLGMGSTYSGTAGAWASADYRSATGATSVVGTNGATLYITGVQLEKGSTATSFDYRPYGTELALCQRYYLLVASGITKDVSMTYYYFGGQMGGNINFPVQMRTNPSFSSVSGTNYYANYSSNTIDYVDVLLDGGASSLIMGSWYNTAQAAGTTGAAGFLRTNNAASFAAWSAEL